LVVLGVSIDRDPPEKIKQFMQKHDIRFPVALDARYEVAKKYGVQGTPTTFLISSDGKVMGGITGPRAWDSDIAAKMFQQLLKDAS
jgi:cytochrome c biogenesis protein CcmG/thiol:disulfide interchange protein DsbE